ncbi:cell division/cell wall cluster transcriptional repressor MraZ [uncultured Jannaschia sp.]|uniref:division/cell wall cluster transcriptional repressor MraZ n=1 Tax=uncultured Jannaschia sp. TaxID=293347 RepID=UPI002632A398|nr:cell division/cell wall cluster transcriptional repressor MraZ [uncultured Jannaschia sp.]
MKQRFTSTSTHKVDAKGRVSIPAEFRRVLDRGDPDRDPGTNPRVHVLYGDPREPWLTCHSMASFEEIADLLDEMEENDPLLPALNAYYFRHADTLTIDDSGRLILSKSLRDRVGVDGEAVFAGMGKTFRIHSPDAPQESVDPLAALLGTLPEGTSIASLLPRKRRPVD